MEEPELKLLTVEYEQLLEEIREAGRSSWVPWSAYLAATALILGTLRPAGFLMYFASLAMSALGLLVALYVYKLRRQSNLNYARIWEIELRWKDIANTDSVGGRWNPFEWERLDKAWGYRRRLLGVVDFGLIGFTGFLALAWFALGLVELFDIQLTSLEWFIESLAIALVTVVIVGIFGICVTSSERDAHARWTSAHDADVRRVRSCK